MKEVQPEKKECNALIVDVVIAIGVVLIGCIVNKK